MHCALITSLEEIYLLKKKLLQKHKMTIKILNRDFCSIHFNLNAGEIPKRDSSGFCVEFSPAYSGHHNWQPIHKGFTLIIK